MSSLLPMKETSRELVVEVTHALQPWFPEITAKWRQRMFASSTSTAARWPRWSG